MKEKTYPNRDGFDPDKFLKPMEGDIRFQRFIKGFLIYFVIIFIFSFTVLYFFGDWQHDIGPNTPVATLWCNQTVDNNWFIHVAAIDPPVKLDKVIITIITNETKVFSVLLSDVINDPDNYTEIGIVDTDNNSKLSTGDIIILVTQDNGVYLERNSKIQFIYTRTNKFIGRIEMKDYIPKD